MIFRYPPVASLRAFEAASRHLNYTRAAEELFITQSAISHQIKHMEELWQVKLFQRQGRSIILTDAGKKVLPIVQNFLNDLKQTVNSLQDKSHDDKVVRVQLSQSFALKWLVPKLGEFSKEHEDIDVWITTSDEALPQSSNIDLAISYMESEIDGYVCIPILQEYCFPVCSPSFFKTHLKNKKRAEDLIELPLLRRLDNDKSPRWRDWFSANNIDSFAFPKGIHYPDSSMAIQAAIDGQGVALGGSAHVADDISNKRLIRLFDVAVTSPLMFYVICAEKKLDNPGVADFLGWLKDKAEESQALFDKQANKISAAG